MVLFGTFVLMMQIGLLPNAALLLPPLHRLPLSIVRDCLLAWSRVMLKCSHFVASKPRARK